MIYNDEYILVDGEYTSLRPIRMAEQFAATFLHSSGASILDYGSGSGIFAKRLNQSGFNDVVGYDPFSTLERPQRHFDIITCCEVLEHSPNPRQTLKDMLSFAKPETAIVFTTLIQGNNIDKERANFWYIAPRNGHISIYSGMSMAILAEAFNLLFMPGAGAFHILAPRNFSLALPANAVPFFSKLLTAPDEDLSGWHPRERSMVIIVGLAARRQVGPSSFRRRRVLWRSSFPLFKKLCLDLRSNAISLSAR